MIIDSFHGVGQEYFLTEHESIKANKRGLTEKQYRIDNDTVMEIQGILSEKHFPLFSSVEIETINRCNGKCSFCPVSISEPQRPFSKMGEPLFNKIISELQKNDYRGRLALFSNNEPFIDERIERFASIARSNLPHAWIYLYTNGSLLTKSRYLSIIDYLDEMIVDNYNDDFLFTKEIAKIVDVSEKNPVFAAKTKIVMRRLNEIIYSRGGSAPNKKHVKTLDMTCILPFKQMVIRPDGKVSLCCNDALGKMTLGDLNDQSLIEIWNSEKYFRIRHLIYEGRNNIDLCKKCDSLFHPEKY